MGRDTTNTNTGGIGFCGLLTILFIALKLTGYVAWSWWWVLSPVWIPLAIAMVLCAIFAAIVLADAVSRRRRRRQRESSEQEESD